METVAKEGQCGVCIGGSGVLINCECGCVVDSGHSGTRWYSRTKDRHTHNDIGCAIHGNVFDASSGPITETTGMVCVACIISEGSIPISAIGLVVEVGIEISFSQLVSQLMS